MSIPIKLNPIGFDTWYVRTTRAFNNSIGEPGKVRLDYVPGDEPVLKVFVNLDVSLISVEDLKAIAGNLVPSGVSVEWYWENGLPMSYTRLEYLACNGSQKITTGFYLTGASRVETKMLITEWFTGRVSWIFHAYNQAFWSYNYNGGYSTAGRFRWGTLDRYPTRFEDRSTGNQLNKVYEFATEKGYIWRNGVRVSEYNGGLKWGEVPEQEFKTDNPCTLFEAAKARFFSFKISENGESKCNLIPALDPSGIPGMYDTVSNTFKKSATSTPFVAGMTLQQIRDMNLPIPGTVSTLSLSIPCEVYNDSEAWGVIEAAQQNGWTFTFYWTNVVAYLTPQLNDIIGNGNYTIAYDYQTSKLSLGFTLSVTNEQIDEVKSLLPRNLVTEIDPFPIDCTRVEYLRSTGTQYINTKYYLEKADDYVMVDVAEVSRPQYWGAVWGCSKDNEPSYNLELKYYTDNTKFRVAYGDNYTYGFWEQLGTIPSNRNLYVNDGGQWSCNGISVGTLYPADFKCTAPASLFCIYNGTNPGWSRSALKVFGFEIRRAGEPTLNFIPALDPTGAPCMFDTVTRKAFRNNGSDDFIIGIETQQQLDNFLASFPNFSGQAIEKLQINLAEALQTEENEARLAEAMAQNSAVPAMLALDMEYTAPKFYAQLTEYGIRRLYHVPKGYTGSMDEYAAEHEFKLIVEPPMPEEGYWTPVWHEREDCIELEWVETEAAMEGDWSENSSEMVIDVPSEELPE